MIKAPAVLMDLFYTSLPIARSLGRKGVPVFGIDRDVKRIGTKSKYILPLGEATDDDELLHILLKFSSSYPIKPVLFPLSDEYLVFLSKYRQHLSDTYYFSYPRHGTLEELISKKYQAMILSELKLPVPRTHISHRSACGHCLDSTFSFPIIIKPDYHDLWLKNSAITKNIGIQKVLFVNDWDDFEEKLGLLGEFKTLIMQEYIPGNTNNLYYFVGYRNASGKILVSFIGKKLRTFPDTTGSETLLESVHNPHLSRLGEEVLHELDYIGPIGIDFKYDYRDQSYKIIELNCRFGISDGLLLKCGIDFPYIYYNDVQGLETESGFQYEEKIYWHWLEKDIEWFREYGGKDGFTVGNALYHLIRNKYAYSAFAFDDIRPFLHIVIGLLKGASRKASLSFRRCEK